MSSTGSGPSFDQLPILYAALASGVVLYAAVLLFVLEPTGASRIRPCFDSRG